MYTLSDYENLESLQTIQVNRSTIRDCYLLDNKFSIVENYVSPYNFLKMPYSYFWLDYTIDKNSEISKKYNAEIIEFYLEGNNGILQFMDIQDVLNFINNELL